MMEEARQRRMQALALIEDNGMTVTQAAKTMGVSKQRASQMIQRARLERAAEPGL